MAGRGYLPRRREIHGFHDGLQPPSMRGQYVMPLRSIEEAVAIRRDEVHRLRADNHLLAEENVGLRREIDATKEELHALGQLLTKVRADKEARTRELIENGLKLESGLRGLEPVRAELRQLKSEAQKLDALRRELSADAQNMSKEIKRLQAENLQIPTLKLEIDGLQEDLVRARAAFDYEKKANADQIDQKQVLEKNLASMAWKVEKLRAEHKSMEKGGRGSGLGAYGDGYGTERGLYGSATWSSYEQHGFPRR